MQPLLNVPEVATLFQVSTWTVRELVRTGRLPCYRVGGQLRFDPEKIRRCLEEGALGQRGRQTRSPQKTSRAALRLAHGSGQP